MKNRNPHLIVTIVKPDKRFLGVRTKDEAYTLQLSVHTAIKHHIDGYTFKRWSFKTTTGSHFWKPPTTPSKRNSTCLSLVPHGFFLFPNELFSWPSEMAFERLIPVYISWFYSPSTSWWDKHDVCFSSFSGMWYYFGFVLRSQAVASGCHLSRLHWNAKPLLPSFDGLRRSLKVYPSFKLLPIFSAAFSSKRPLLTARPHTLSRSRNLKSMPSHFPLKTGSPLQIFARDLKICSQAAVTRQTLHPIVPFLDSWFDQFWPTMTRS